MKLSCTQENLNLGLSIVSHITAKNTTLPILNNVLLKTKEGGLELLTTNLEIGVTSTLRGKIEEEGSITVPAKLIADYVSLLPRERVDIALEDQNLKLKCNNFETTIKGITADEFPLIPQVERKEAAICQIKDFKKALSQVIFAVSLDSSRPEISGVLLSFKPEKLIMAATDSYRLAEKTIALERSFKEERDIIVPAKTLQELLRIVSDSSDKPQLEIYVSENQILFSFQNTIELVSRIIDGQYPDYKQIIPPASKTKIVTDRAGFIKIIKSASLFCKSGINDVHLKFLPKEREIVANAINTQLGENVSRLEAEIAGEENEIVFNYRYLLDGLANIDTEEVILEVINNNSPGVLKPKDGGDYVYLIMPIKQ